MSGAKMEYALVCSELMPAGKPKFLEVIKYPTIKSLSVQMGKKPTLALIVTLVKNFCDSFNVVRNMNQQQMIEAAVMLLDECDNFRLEDYAMMFQMAKRGELKDIHDRIDLQVITEILDAYWQRRHQAGESHVADEINHIDTLGNTTRLGETVHLQDMRLLDLGTGFASALTDMKKVINEKVGDRDERARLKEIEEKDTAAIREQLKSKGYATDKEVQG